MSYLGKVGEMKAPGGKFWRKKKEAIGALLSSFPYRKLTLCPLGQPKKAIGPEPQIEPWLTHVQRNPSGLLNVSEIGLESTHSAFPLTP
jgi:hypothetical protein